MRSLAGPLPCCPTAEPQYVRDLEHAVGLDFDLFRCTQCGRHWVQGYYEGSGSAAWEDVSTDDAHAMATIPEPELRPYMTRWGRARGF